MSLSTRYTRFSASEAVARAKSWSSWQTGMCLNYVWNALDVPNSAGLANANESWAAAVLKVYAGTPPPGAPVYWQSGRYGHIALSLGGGWVRSTDIPSLGRIGNITIGDLSREWGATYRGWSRDYAGHPIAGLQVVSGGSGIPAPAQYNFGSAYVVDDEALRSGRHSNAARLFNARAWSWLYWKGGTSGRTYCTANYKAWMAEPSDLFGAQSIKAMNQMYRILDGGSPAYTYPGPALLRRLGLRAD